MNIEVLITTFFEKSGNVENIETVFCTYTQTEYIRQKGKEIAQSGWHQSLRNGNTGVGYTYECLFGIPENNSPDADLFNSVEVKTHRLPARSMLSLFTLSPKHPKFAPSLLLDKFGAYNDHGYKSLYTTIRGTNQNTNKKRYRFNLRVCRQQKKIFIEVRCIKSGLLMSGDVYYNFSDIKKSAAKIEKLVLTGAKVSKINGVEYFQYSEPKLMVRSSFETLLSLIEQGIVRLDIRLGTYRTGKNAGKTRDHGAAFRIRHQNISELFSPLEYTKEKTVNF